MRRAMTETERRRTKQIRFNEEHGITPKSVSKRIKDIIDGVYDAEAAQRELKAAEETATYEAMSERELAREIKRLEKEMQDFAKNLEFEKAAAARDALFRLRAGAFGAATHDTEPNA
jgi:excinuclease ABC subunit B